MQYGKVCLRRGEEKDVRGGSFWIFDNEIDWYDDICPDGGIVDVDGRKAGVFKDTDGQCHIVDPRCPHLGCQLAWNPDERTWDCPCHGSRFRYDGTLIDNPAQEGLQ